MARFTYSITSSPTRNPNRPETNHIYYAYLNISLIFTGEPVNLKRVFIDTGAQWCLFNNDIAPRLGIQNFKDTKDTVKIWGIGGKLTNIGYFYDVRLIIYKDSKKLTLDNAWQVDTRVGFLENPIGFGGILGVYGFLDQFIFKSVIPKSYFEIEPLYQD